MQLDPAGSPAHMDSIAVDVAASPSLQNSCELIYTSWTGYTIWSFLSYMMTLLINVLIVNDLDQ